MFWVCSKAALSHPVSTAPKLTRWVSLKSCFKSSVSLPSTASVHGVCNSQQSSILPSSGGAKRHQVQAEAFCSGVLDESIVPYTLCIHQIPLITPLFLWEDIVAHSNAAERKKKKRLSSATISIFWKCAHPHVGYSSLPMGLQGPSK